MISLKWASNSNVLKLDCTSMYNDLNNFSYCCTLFCVGQPGSADNNQLLQPDNVIVVIRFQNVILHSFGLVNLIGSLKMCTTVFVYCRNILQISFLQTVQKTMFD